MEQLRVIVEDIQTRPDRLARSQHPQTHDLGRSWYIDVQGIVDGTKGQMIALGQLTGDGIAAGMTRECLGYRIDHPGTQMEGLALSVARTDTSGGIVQSVEHMDLLLTIRDRI